MDKSLMAGKYKTSYFIVGGILLLIIFSLIPWEKAFPSGPRVGIIDINTPIMESRQTVTDLNYFLNEKSIIAIVVRLETPGGTVAASQEIYEKVKAISEKSAKPIIASMGAVAASGGYYVAMGADTIIANPGTATGSIGVIMGYPIVAELMEKLGIKYVSVTSGDLKDAGSVFREMSQDERNYFQALIDNLHSQFVRAVSYERNLPEEEVNMLANGQVFSGEQALSVGLIDILGTFEEAVSLAAMKAGYTAKPELVFPPKEKKGLLDYILGDFFQSSTLAKLSLYPIPEYSLNYRVR